MSSTGRYRGGRALSLAVAASLAVLTAVAPRAAGRPTLEDLRGRLDRIQRRLDATTERIEALRTEAERTRRRIVVVEARRAELGRRAERLQALAAQRADDLYRDGGAGMLEVLFAAGDFADLTDRAELLARVSQEAATTFTRLARARAQQAALARELADRERRLDATTEELHAVSDRLQRQFRDVSERYETLKARLARAARARRADAVSAAGMEASVIVPSSGGMACPVAGPVSFVDSWGAPRDGHTHQGVDMMAAYGTPVVAVASGTITYSAYDGSGGNMIFLSGDDGNAYWYMHNQENLVGGGHVSAGQQIARVGDTGNAEGTPHLHFEYHPGGGAAVDPYPLVSSIC